MNGMRTARKFIEKQSTKELIHLQALAKEETSQEGMVVFYLIQAELERRKVKDLYLKGMIPKELYDLYMK